MMRRSLLLRLNLKILFLIWLVLLSIRIALGIWWHSRRYISKLCRGLLKGVCIQFLCTIIYFNLRLLSDLRRTHSSCSTTYSLIFPPFSWCINFWRSIIRRLRDTLFICSRDWSCFDYFFVRWSLLLWLATRIPSWKPLLAINISRWLSLWIIKLLLFHFILDVLFKLVIIVVISINIFDNFIIILVLNFDSILIWLKGIVFLSLLLSLILFNFGIYASKID